MEIFSTSGIEVPMNAGRIIDLNLVPFRVIVQMVAENISCLSFDGAYRGELNILALFPALPIDQVVLAVDTKPHLLSLDTVRPGFPVAGKPSALSVDEIDLVIDRFRAELCNLGNSPDGLLGNDFHEDRLVLVGLLLTGKGLVFDRKCMPTRLAYQAA